MRRVFRLLAVVLDAIVGVAEDKPDKRYMSVYEAQDKLDNGLITIREYNEAFESKDVL
ncbi:TPA: hypothetical protein JBD37_03355 [Legionella pneumophila subsp. pneumophila]|uniref:Uncharacterized protein n=2 Tax=Legionella pneumophila TaxID=446 RepID=A0A4T1G0W6_LEGPN|nr:MULTISPECIES: hypothetical protein [Legionella]MCK0182750.1 hypothetical protein [Legionella pneumophila]MCK1870577.1 hypothetical protein [Legionella pneumophila]MCK1880265.1 hypothetical protein [Legionella pneumophila]MCK1889588.1 hypothetical protein [Legionella pneumophila]MCO1452607.1 hypothetical protein [Legionella pneumophila]